ncbi:hypothetical protein J6590_046071 [Homalodisca vitripennis]|nr:hypothetical protein J6590_046071 [Homalodisca vitripennis]
MLKFASKIDVPSESTWFPPYPVTVQYAPHYRDYRLINRCPSRRLAAPPQNGDTLCGSVVPHFPMSNARNIALIRQQWTNFE